MKFWLHRITGGDHAMEFAYPLLFTHNCLSIGWSYLSTDKFVKDVLANGASVIDDATKKAGWGLPKNRWNLWRFIKGMKKGDIVLVPTSYEFSLFEITDDEIMTNESIDGSIYQDWNGKLASRNDDGHFYNEEGKNIDLGFYRRVKQVLINIPRSGYADQNLTSRMKIRQTNADISDLQESIEKAKNAYEEKKPINLKEKIVEETVPKIIALIENLTNDYSFEKLVRWYLQSLGAKIEIPPKNESKTEDGDADVVGFFENIKTAIMVQVKKHKDTTEDWAIQQIKAYRTNHNYDDYHTQMWVISSCDQFSMKAMNEAEAAGVRLINGVEFAKMILDTGLGGLNL